MAPPEKETAKAVLRLAGRGSEHLQPLALVRSRGTDSWLRVGALFSEAEFLLSPRGPGQAQSGSVSVARRTPRPPSSCYAPIPTSNVTREEPRGAEARRGRRLQKETRYRAAVLKERDKNCIPVNPREAARSNGTRRSETERALFSDAVAGAPKRRTDGRIGKR